MDRGQSTVSSQKPEKKPDTHLECLLRVNVYVVIRELDIAQRWIDAALGTFECGIV